MRHRRNRHASRNQPLATGPQSFFVAKAHFVPDGPYGPNAIELQFNQVYAVEMWDPSLWWLYAKDGRQIRNPIARYNYGPRGLYSVLLFDTPPETDTHGIIIPRDIGCESLPTGFFMSSYGTSIDVPFTRHVHALSPTWDTY